MLRIECESCHAPYQVDERRIPPQGLKMRCPKCGHTFSVQKDGATSTDAGAPKPAPNKAKMTMVGLGDELGLPAAKPALPKAPPIPPRPAAAAPPAPAPPVDADLPAARPAPPRPPPPVPRAGMVPPRPAPPATRPATPAAKPPAPADFDLPAMREKVSSLPAALGNMDDLDLPAARPGAKPAAAAPPAAFGEIDLPAIAADLPARPPAPAKPAPARGGSMSFDLDLPNPKAAPAAKSPDDLELDLGPPAADLPAPLPDLPAVAASLPARKAEPAFGEIDLPSVDAQLPAVASALPTVASALPTVASALPVVAGNLPAVASALPAVADVLPAVGQQLPSTVTNDRLMPAQKESLDFGEVDLGPIGGAAVMPPPALPPRGDDPGQSLTRDAPFPDLDLGAADLKSVPPSKPPAPQKATNALTFGEVDLGAQAGAPGASIQTEEPIPSQRPPAAPTSGDELSLPGSSMRPSGPGTAPVEVSLPVQTNRGKRERAEQKKPSRAGRVVLGLLVIAVAGGGALQLTRHGAFGYLTIGDALHAKDYAAFAASESSRARERAGKDVYPEARGAIDDLFAAHWKMPRASALGAYAAFAEFSYEMRFGADVDRNAKAKLILADAAAKSTTPHLDLAYAAEDAAAGNLDKARKALEAASKRDPGDPIQRDVALLRGEVELAAHDGRAAKAAFQSALKLGAKAQAHYGLARVAMMERDWTAVGSECDAAIAATPHHPGALLLRALERYTEKGDDTGAIADLTEITEGPAKALASQREVAQAFANRGHIFLASGRAGDARTAFDAALKVDPRNVDALVGQGTVFFQESRFTEALTRFDTALQARPNDEIATSYDALAKIKLERLKDAKDQLVAARAKFPKSAKIMFALAQAETALGNGGDAEKDLRQAIDWASPKDPESVEPYIALATLLASKPDRDKDAQQVIDDAKSKLPDEAPVAVAFGEYDAAQGRYEDAVAHFKHALELSPSSLSTHFKLGVTYRHMRKPDLAGTEFDQVLAIDKDYPGLALERGLLFEESGEVERALEQFKNALARAPNDADLQLRVGAAYVAIGRPTDALPMLRKVLEKRPTSAEANHYLGRAIFADQGATQEAMRFLKRAVELDPNRAEYHLYVGWAANEANPADLGTAGDEIKAALGLDKLLADAYWQRGELERKRLAVDDALKDERHALDLKPTRIDAYATMAECYEDKNDQASALTNWAKAVAGNDRNPYWRFRYGKLLLEHGNAGEAAPHLSFAVEEALKKDVRPPWIAPAEFAAAQALQRTGKRPDAITMYRRYLEIASTNDPDRRDALNALTSLGETYRPGGQ